MTTRICQKCNQEKQLNDFAKDKNKPLGYDYRCKSCKLKPGVLKRRPRGLTSASKKESWRRYKFPKDVCDRLETNNFCAVCGKTPEQNKKALAVDHNHTTGLIRELLCIQCNLVLGLVKEDLNLLRSLIVYLNKHHGL
jgi:hypothetical protein